MQENNSKILPLKNVDQDVVFTKLAVKIKQIGQELGFSAVSISNVDTRHAIPFFKKWIKNGYHGQMNYMADRLALRNDPKLLLPEISTIISVSLPYYPTKDDAKSVLANPEYAYISRYALGRDYHKVMRHRMNKMVLLIDSEIKSASIEHQHTCRVFSDSAPVLEVEFASKSGLGWRGKNTLLLNKNGSWHFLGEILTSLPLPIDAPVSAHCGSCQQCLKVCPTGAIVAPYEIDARRCISYLTIEFSGVIPMEFRPLMGNRIYGCDDCQIYCPWNRFAISSDEAFFIRNNLNAVRLTELFQWSQREFEDRLSGTPIRRIGYEKWLRNIAVALGNSQDKRNLSLLSSRLKETSSLVQTHIEWAIERLS